MALDRKGLLQKNCFAAVPLLCAPGGARCQRFLTFYLSGAAGRFAVCRGMDYEICASCGLASWQESE